MRTLSKKLDLAELSMGKGGEEAAGSVPSKGGVIKNLGGGEAVSAFLKRGIRKERESNVVGIELKELRPEILGGKGSRRGK